MGCMALGLAVGIAERLSRVPGAFGMYKTFDCAEEADHCFYDKMAESLGTIDNVTDRFVFGDFTRFTVRLEHQVYAYSSRGITVYLAFTFLFLHTLAVVIYALYNWFPGPKVRTWSIYQEQLT